MKISELSRRSGVPLATIKFYQRERLLPPGTATGPNQAAYGDPHLRRLALIRTLREIGGLSLATIGRIVQALDAPGVPLEDLVGEVVDSLGEEGRTPPREDAASLQAGAEIDRFLADEGLISRPEGTAREILVDSLVSMRRHVDPEVPVDVLQPYLAAMRGLATWEIEYLPSPAPLEAGGDPAETGELLESIVYGTVLFERVILALRRLLHEAAFLESRGVTPAPVSVAPTPSE